MASKYIDADALEVVCFTDREGSFSDGVQWLLEYIDRLPSADVAEVVRCKNCRYWNESDIHSTIHPNRRCRAVIGKIYTDSEFYCAYGERKDGEHGWAENLV